MMSYRRLIHLNWACPDTFGMPVYILNLLIIITQIIVSHIIGVNQVLVQNSNIFEIPFQNRKFNVKFFKTISTTDNQIFLNSVLFFFVIFLFFNHKEPILFNIIS